MPIVMAGAIIGRRPPPHHTLAAAPGGRSRAGLTRPGRCVSIAPAWFLACSGSRHEDQLRGIRGAAIGGARGRGSGRPGGERAGAGPGGAVSRAVAAAARFHGKKNELIPIIGPAELKVSRIVVAGLGKPEAVDERLVQDLGGNLVAHLNGAGATEAVFAVDLGDSAKLKPAHAAAQLAFGAQLRAYRFDKYRTKQKPEQKPSLAAVTIAADTAGEAKKAYRALGAVAEAVAFTRDLVSEPANELYPESMADRAAGLREFGVEVEILDEPRLRELGMGALLGVAQGSARPPRVVVMQYH